MPDALNMPGVFVEEIPSGTRAILPVATSVTAFVGRAARGPVGTPTTVSSFVEFERVFGGLWSQSRLGFAVRDFFANGGSEAVIVRIYRPKRATRTKALLSLGTLVLEAAAEGSWGNHLQARVTLGSAPRFHLHIRDDATGVVEEHRDLVAAPAGDPRHVTTVLARESRLVHVSAVGSTRPAPTRRSAPDVGVTADGIALDGLPLIRGSFTVGGPAGVRGLYALNKMDSFNVLVIPPHRSDDSVDPAVVAAAAEYCERRRAVLILDAPPSWDSVEQAAVGASGFVDQLGTSSANAAVYFPRLRQSNPLNGGAIGIFAAAGAVAGVIARTDAARGLWKAPAGMEATLNGVVELDIAVSDADAGRLNPLAVNCLRTLPHGNATATVVWGARTLHGSDSAPSEWKYLPVRRLALHIEGSVERGLAWAAFEPNGEPLWAQIRLAVGTFLEDLLRGGAFQGTTRHEAYYVRCDATTTTVADVAQGIVNVEIGFAPLRPAEFIVLRVQQVAQPT